MKSKHIDWTLGLKCDHRVWPWPWSWSGFSRSNMEFAISPPKMVRLLQNERQTYRLNSKASNLTIGFALGHDLDLEFSRPNMEFPISQPKVVWLPQNEKQTYKLNSRPQMWQMGLTLTITLTFEFWRSNVTLTNDHTHDLDHGFSWSNFEIAISQNGRADWLTLHKEGGSRSFMTMTMTIWWPRSGVWIYQLVTGVTSVVGVPSTHLVYRGIDGGPAKFECKASIH